MTVQPLHDRVLLKLDLPKQSGLIVVPDAYREEERTGVVLAVGPGKLREDESGRYLTPTQVKPGDRVLVSPGVNINYDDIIRRNGELLVQEADIMGVLVEQ